MNEESSDAIVLRTFEYNESDKLVRFATRDFGKISGIAKGAKRSKRRFPNALETFSHVDLRFKWNRKGGLVFVSGCDLIEPRTRISSDFLALALASYFTEIVDLTLTERQDAKRVFFLLDWALRWLDLHVPKMQILPFFQLKWLAVSGLQPELRYCLVCQSPNLSGEGLSFSPQRGGIVCGKCRWNIGERSLSNNRSSQEVFFPVQRGTMNSLAALQKAEPETFARIELSWEQFREAHSILTSFLHFHIGREFKSIRFLEQMIPPGSS